VFFDDVLYWQCVESGWSVLMTRVDLCLVFGVLSEKQPPEQRFHEKIPLERHILANAILSRTRCETKYGFVVTMARKNRERKSLWGEEMKGRSQ